MKNIILVFIGGGIGSALRYAFAKWIPYSGQGFPWHTFLVNILGCLIIGIILGYILKLNSQQTTLALLLATGFCGGFTTFSAFAFENIQLFKSGDMMTFTIYMLLSIIIGFLMVGVGIWVSKFI